MDPNQRNQPLSQTPASADTVLQKLQTVTHPEPTWLINLIQVIKEISALTTSKPDKLKFNFNHTRAAVEDKTRVLEKYGNDLERAIQAQIKSPVGYGSKFWPREQLVKLFGLHPCWQRMESILTWGSLWPLKDLDEEHWKLDLEEALVFGNHEGAQKHPTHL